MEPSAPGISRRITAPRQNGFAVGKSLLTWARTSTHGPFMTRFAASGRNRWLTDLGATFGSCRQLFRERVEFVGVEMDARRGTRFLPGGLSGLDLSGVTPEQKINLCVVRCHVTRNTLTQ